jgi:hypothetical protein
MRQQRNANVVLLAMLIALICLFLASSIRSAEIKPTGTVAPHRLIHVKYDAAVNGVVFVLGIRDGKLLQPDIVDVAPGYLVWTGPPGFYSVHGIEGGKRFSQVVEIAGDGSEPDPSPPGPPKPSPVLPIGFAKDVYDQARKVNDPGGAAKIAENLDSVVMQLENNFITSVREAIAMVSQLNRGLSLGASWKEFGGWLGKQFNERAQSVPTAIESMKQASEGLKAASQ